MALKVKRDPNGETLLTLPCTTASTAIEAVEIRDFLQVVFRRFPSSVEKTSAQWETAIRGEPHPDTVWWCRNMAAMLNGCEIVLWEKPMWNLAFKGHESLVGSQVEPETLIPTPRPVFLKPQLWLMRGDVWDVSRPYGYVIARLIQPDLHRSDKRPVLWTIEIAYTSDGELGLDSYFIRLDEPLKEGDTCRVACAAFLNLPVTEKTEDRLPRQYRRQLQRKQAALLPTVYTVRLRRPAERNSRNGCDSDRSYHCHWLNGAHWRNQWYPSKGLHHPKFIAAYVKGDRSKPFKEPSERVFHVAR